MLETPEELDNLQQLLDRSMAGAGSAARMAAMRLAALAETVGAEMVGAGAVMELWA